MTRAQKNMTRLMMVQLCLSTFNAQGCNWTRTVELEQRKETINDRHVDEMDKDC